MTDDQMMSIVTSENLILNLAIQKLKTPFASYDIKYLRVPQGKEKIIYYNLPFQSVGQSKLRKVKWVSNIPIMAERQSLHKYFPIAHLAAKCFHTLQIFGFGRCQRFKFVIRLPIEKRITRTCLVCQLHLCSTSLFFIGVQLIVFVFVYSIYKGVKLM